MFVAQVCVLATRAYDLDSTQTHALNSTQTRHEQTHATPLIYIGTPTWRTYKRSQEAQAGGVEPNYCLDFLYPCVIMGLEYLRCDQRHSMLQLLCRHCLRDATHEQNSVWWCCHFLFLSYSSACSYPADGIQGYNVHTDLSAACSLGYLPLKRSQGLGCEIPKNCWKLCYQPLPEASL